MHHLEHLPYRYSPGPFKHFLSINPSILPASHPQEVNTDWFTSSLQLLEQETEHSGMK